MKKILLILATVIIIAIGAWGIWAYRQAQVNGARVGDILAPTEMTTATSTISLALGDETANWKTYTNDKYGFSFKYPVEFDNIVNTEDKTQVAFFDKDHIAATVTSGGLDVYDLGQGFGYVYMVVLDSNGNLVGNSNPIDLRLAWPLDTSRTTKRMPLKYNVVDLSLVSGKQLSSERYTELSKMFDKILATFSSSVDKTVGWKTYTNYTYGFTLDFPDSWKGYSTKENENGVIFKIKDQDVFTISAWTHRRYAELKNEAELNPLPIDLDILGQNSKYIFTLTVMKNTAPESVDLTNQTIRIAATLKAVEPK